jgi:hypothetical protein
LKLPEHTGSHSEVSAGWENAFGEAVAKLAGVLAQRQDESAARLDTLERDVADLKRRLTEKSTSILAPIDSLEPEPYELTKTVQALVLPDGDSYVASLLDGNINASGDTVQDAVFHLKDMMVKLFEGLGKQKDKLGKQPSRQLAFLHSIMRRKA